MIPSAWTTFRSRAAQSPRKIVLSDGEDPRVIKAAAVAQQEGFAHPVLVGDASKILPLWKQIAPGIELDVVNAQTLSREQKELYIDSLHKTTKFKALSPSDLETLLKDSLNLGCLLVKHGYADGFIGGAARTTTDTLRAIFPIIGLGPKTSTLFGFFLIEARGSAGQNGSLVLLADCAVIPDPSPKQLANIAIGSISAYEFLTQHIARPAFLSFSTAGSAEHPMVDRIRQARDMAREKCPTRTFEGEWQADSALDAFTAKIKGVGASPMAGKANVLIVPDLNCGNIAYKLVQRLGGCRAVGPVLWGTAKPANDLSRGCSADDVADMIAITVIQAQQDLSVISEQPAARPEGDRTHA